MSWDASLYKDQHAFVFQYGESLLEWLQPKAGEHIVDLGCGTGELTAKIAESGAEVTGLDASKEMIASAKEHFPGLHFEVADATKFSLPRPVDAIFSNATLHWVSKKKKAAARMFAALKPGGRLVLEMGGKGNMAIILAGLKKSLLKRGYEYDQYWYFPSVAQYTKVLENAGFRVNKVSYFDRPTQLSDPNNGVAVWLRMFGTQFFKGIPEAERAAILQEVNDWTVPQLTHNGLLLADYRRLRIEAVKEA
ncbi:Trans-aconitate methyltransferase [Chitinophaga costaii]|uniref:Trans-aconitate methyltransferase n=1 Tax=Chitinophaga costaii TaxID=1335309 RepID=A0A1C3Z894_9BACT|nr:class I SAM-dependent methyltransferase [Chitinophaga costaii]PUZ30271.1 class I SAM-dependent methyltransferase [Chitinophaga costaii]SCB78589.1 Trans-aconitate methyltransferase [Chitinophaga costaii]